MKYCSTRDHSISYDFGSAVISGLAPDGGLFVPTEKIALGKDWGETLPDVAHSFLKHYVGDVISDERLAEIIQDALNFEIPLVEIEPGVYVLELFHGPTLAFKDVGARFMGRILPELSGDGSEVVVLVATSGDTGGAVANGLLNVPGVKVVVLYPKGKVSPLQEKQFASLGANVHALCVDGVFDDCQRLVKGAFADKDITSRMNLTTANSINIARWIPQAVYYLWMYKQLQKRPVISVPSGNFGNFTAGILAYKAKMPARRFIAACNINDTVPRYLESGSYEPKPSIQTIANAMDVGDPSNFERLLYLFEGKKADMDRVCFGAAYTDEQIRDIITDCYKRNGYLLDPHGACGYQALMDNLVGNESGVFMATAHPAKFAGVYKEIGIDTPLHPTLESLRDKPLLSEQMSNDPNALKDILLAL